MKTSFMNFLCNVENFLEYSSFAVNVASSNLCVKALQKIKISFFLLSICTDELISTPQIKTLLPKTKFRIEKNERE